MCAKRLYSKKGDQFATWAAQTDWFPSSGGAGVNSAGETWHYVGESGPIYHNQLGNDYEGVIDAAISDARGREAFVSGSSLAGAAANGGGKNWLSKVWNSDIARLYIPDVIYMNGSGVLTFLGGGGADGGLALPLRGQDAGKVYSYGTLKGKTGLHGGISANLGTSFYQGPVDLFDFDSTFKGISSGVEVDYIIGAGISANEYDQYGNTLISIDVGVGPGIGGSINIGAETHVKPIFRLW